MDRRISRASWWRLRAGGAALLLAACAPGPGPPAPPPPSAPEPPPQVAPAVPPPPCRRIAGIEVRKGERRLIARCEGGRVRELVIALGREPAGAKRLAGDSRTPEGHYRISGEPQSSRFHLFIPIDYPSVEDADAARAEGRISPRDHQRILAAHARGEPPPKDTPLGGDLGLHGEGARWRGDSPHLDWTYGCIALSDDDVAFLAERAPVGTPVVIRP